MRRLEASSSRREVYSCARGEQVFCEVVKVRERLWGCGIPWVRGVMWIVPWGCWVFGVGFRPRGCWIAGDKGDVVVEYEEGL